VRQFLPVLRPGSPAVHDLTWAHAVSRWLLTANAEVRSQGVHMRFVVGKVALGLFLRVLWFSPFSIIPPLLNILSSIIWGMDSGLVNGRSPQRQSPPNNDLKQQAGRHSFISSLASLPVVLDSRSYGHYSSAITRQHRKMQTYIPRGVGSYDFCNRAT
jgi:hypothetical protein